MLVNTALGLLNNMDFNKRQSLFFIMYLPLYIYIVHMSHHKKVYTVHYRFVNNCHSYNLYL